MVFSVSVPKSEAVQWSFGSGRSTVLQDWRCASDSGAVQSIAAAMIKVTGDIAAAVVLLAAIGWGGLTAARF